MSGRGSAWGGIVPCPAPALRAGRPGGDPAAAAVGALTAGRRAVAHRAARGQGPRQPLAAPGAFPHAEYRNAPRCKIRRSEIVARHLPCPTFLVVR